MSKEIVEVKLHLTPKELKALRELVQVYLSKGGPAYECMQEWDEEHDVKDLTSLRDKVEEATK